MNRVEILIGLPGSGKDTAANTTMQYAKICKIGHTVIISLDNIREMINGKYVYDFELEAFVFSIGRKAIWEAMDRRYNVIINDSMWSLTRDMRKDLITYIRGMESRLGAIDITAVQIMTPISLCKERRSLNPRTLKAADWHRIIDEQAKFYEPIIDQDAGLAEGFDRIVTISGEGK